MKSDPEDNVKEIVASSNNWESKENVNRYAIITKFDVTDAETHGSSMNRCHQRSPKSHMSSPGDWIKEEEDKQVGGRVSAQRVEVPLTTICSVL